MLQAFYQDHNSKYRFYYWDNKWSPEIKTFKALEREWNRSGTANNVKLISEIK